MSESHTPEPAIHSVVEFGARRTLVVVGTMLATLLSTVDSTITNVALPAMQGNLGASMDEATWIINGYIIAVVVVIPIIPWLQTVLGRKRYFLISVAGFTVMSLLCGIAGSIPMLIAFRVLQGMFGAGLLATAQTILRDTFPAEQLGLSQALFALGAIVGPALGPPLGGWLVDNFSWNWVFLINLAPGIASAAILSAVLRDPFPAREAPLDWVGLVLLVGGIGSLQYLLSEGQRYDWFSDSNNVLCAVAAATGIAGLILWSLYGTRRPLVDIAIFKYRTLATGFALALAIGAALLGTLYVLPQYVENSLGFTATLSGLLLLVKAAPIAACTVLIVPFVNRYDSRYFIAAGFLLTAFASVWQGFVTTPASTFWSFGGPLILSGIAVSMMFVPISVAVLGALPQEEGGSASAWINLGSQLGGSISIAVLSTMVESRTAFHQSVLAGHQTLAQLHLGGTSANWQLAGLEGLVGSQALIMGYADTSYAVAALCAVAAPLVFAMRRPRIGGPVEFGG